MAERAQQITRIFHSAIARQGTERRAFLDGACADDSELRREVESLIESHERAGSFIDAPAYDRNAELLQDEHQANLAGRNLGRYRIVSLLGAGGMGEVAPGIWKVPADGGPASKISDATTWAVEVSPDGQFLALVAFIGQTTQPRISILKFNDLTPFKTFDVPVTVQGGWSFSPDSRAIVYGDTRGGVANLWRMPLDGSPAKQIIDFNSDLINFFAYSRDGKQLALSRGSTTRDALMITDEEQ